MFSYLLFLVDSFTSLNAQTISKDKIGERIYIIGKHMFNRDAEGDYQGRLTTQYIMLGTTSIESSNIKDMVIYYKNPNGEWKNPISNKDITSPSTFKIEYKNGYEYY